MAARCSARITRSLVASGAIFSTAPVLGQALIGTSFQGSTSSQSGFIPPDTMGAVGPSHFVELINGRYAVYDKSDGSLLQAASLDAFWAMAGAPPSGAFSFDPRILYDHSSGRWFAAAADAPLQPNNLLVAVSDGSDPTDGWTGFKIDSDSNNQQWADFPTMGIDESGLYVAANMFAFGGGDFYVHVLVIPKADLVGANPTVANATLLQNLEPGSTFQPVVNFDNDTPGVVPILGELATDQGLIVRGNLLGPVTDPAFSLDALVNIPPSADPPDADQPALPFPKQDIETLDTRIGSSVILRNGVMWAVQDVASAGRAAVRWLKINPATNTVIQQGLINHPTLAFYYPSIAVNEFNDVLIGFSGSSSSQPVSSYAVAGLTLGGVTTFAAPLLLRAGLDDYQVLDGAGRNRWGDYSATMVDPLDPDRFWTIQEFVLADDVWATQITEVILAPPIGACCLEDGTCVDTIEASECAEAMGGAWQGFESVCSELACPYLLGACCSAGGCSEGLSEAVCEAVAGFTFLGPGSTCGPDCNRNGSADGCDIAAGTSGDCNANDTPDECDIALGSSRDQDGDGIPDECEGPPPNDFCTQALIVEEGAAAFTTVGATSAGPLEPGCASGEGQIDSDIWYRFVSDCTGTVTISLCGSNFDTRLAVYSIVCPAAPGTAIACNDDFCAGQSRVSFESTPLQTYNIRIGGAGGAAGVGTMVITCTPNDSCELPLFVQDSTSFSTLGATTDGFPESDCGGPIESDVWYFFAAPCDGQATVSVCQADFDTRLAVYAGFDCPSGPDQAVACSDDACATRSQVVFPVATGMLFRVRIGGAPGERGEGVLAITCGPLIDCPTDTNGDGQTDVQDLVAVIVAWDMADPSADVNDDGVVDVLDLVAVIVGWGKCA